MPPVGFEPTISAGERLQTYALDRAATGTGCYVLLLYQMYITGLRNASLLHTNFSILCYLEIVSFEAAMIALHDY